MFRQLTWAGMHSMVFMYTSAHYVSTYVSTIVYVRTRVHINNGIDFYYYSTTRTMHACARPATTSSYKIVLKFSFWASLTSSARNTVIHQVMVVLLVMHYGIHYQPDQDQLKKLELGYHVMPWEHAPGFITMYNIS